MSIRSEPVTRRSSRLRSLTQRAQEQYESTVDKYSKRLQNFKTDIDSCIRDINERLSSHDQYSIVPLHELLDSCVRAYDTCSSEFLKYLHDIRTVESQNEASIHLLTNEMVHAKVRLAQSRLENAMADHIPVGKHTGVIRQEISSTPRVSVEPCYSLTHSNHSTSSSRLLQQIEAKLEASRVRLKFVEEEAAIIKQRADLESRLKLVRAEQEINVLETKAEVMKRDTTCTSEIDNRSVSRVKQERTEEFVESLPSHSNQYGRSTIEDQSKPIHAHTCGQEILDKKPPAQFIARNNNEPKFHLNPYSEPFSHRTELSRDPMSEFSKFLVKKDLLLSRLTKYDDNPMLYMTWKLNFKNIMSELDVSPTEELDLLVRWLGPNSSRQAASLRACNAHNSTIALAKIWERLEERFGSPEMVENSLKQRIASFPKLDGTECKRLYDLADLTTEIASVKMQPIYSVLFGYFDSSTGVNLIVSKLPRYLQDKWTLRASSYKSQYRCAYPPFTFFVDFINDMAKMKNDPSFHFERVDKQYNRLSSNRSRPSITVKKSCTTEDNHIVNSNKLGANERDESVRFDSSQLCPLHKTNHLLNQCTGFRRMPLDERKKFILKNGICFKCCGPHIHRAKNCKATVHCGICKGDSHPTALHVDLKQHVGEQTASKNVESTCTHICGTTGITSKSCAKILPVTVYHEHRPDVSRTMYALIDDQSSHSLASSSFFDFFMEDGPGQEYTLVSCAGKVTTSGRRGSGYVVESLDHTCKLQLPTLIECNDIPNNRDEIPTPELVQQFPHLQDIVSSIPSLFNDADIDLLLGRDIIKVHHVQDQILCGDSLPIAQKLPLGWVVVGQVCMGKLHHSEVVSVNKTFLQQNGRPSLFEPCDSKLTVTTDLFLKTEHDEKVGLSIEDQTFLQVMNKNYRKDPDGHWSSPLPFREDRLLLPNNKTQALKRAKLFDISLRHDPVKKQHTIEFMDKIFSRGYAEEAPDIPEDQEQWFLPMFGVYHPKKPDAIRLVFDSSARFKGTSLNEVLMKGPDITNSLQGILLRFRREHVAVTGDVEQMFYQFRVHEPHRNYLRFLWHSSNDLEKPLREYRMTVHVFGNRPSPAVATYGIRKSVMHADPEVQDFVNRNFYVDDGLVSCPSVQDAVDLMKKTQLALLEGGQMRLHKIASNSKEFLHQFDKVDLAKDIKNLDIGKEDLPVQRSLGLSWDTESDTFIFRLSFGPKPFTRRGVLSTINSLFDPLGFTAPVTLEGKLLLKEMMTTAYSSDWDEPLPQDFKEQWEAWVESLRHLEDVKIERMYCKYSVNKADSVEIHIFSDASRDAIAAVAYLRVFTEDNVDVGFLLGKAKVAPSHGHTIPRLELCAGVLAVELAEIIKEQMDMSTDAFHFFTDSSVVLGYISNETRRFHVYVSNRVSRIRAFSGPQQWNHISTDQNPADQATRKFKAHNLPESLWIQGPQFLYRNERTPLTCDQSYPLIDATNDKEVKPQVSTVKTTVEPNIGLGCERFQRFSSWNSLVRGLVLLKTYIQKRRSCAAEVNLSQVVLKQNLTTLIIKEAQRNAFSAEISAIKDGKEPPKSSSLLRLNPILDQDGILRVGGRLSCMNPKVGDKMLHPIIIPRGHVATLLVRHFHSGVHHQGRQITEGAVCNAGYWVLSLKRVVSSVVHNCVLCKRLRGKLGWTLMADLPKDRLEPSPPFTFVGVDVFGPWQVMSRRTRGGSANSKRWGLLFTCLVSRAVHIELIEEVSSASFINGLRRFIALRGPVQHFRSDRGTNFVGAVNQLEIDAKFVESGNVGKFLFDNSISWTFNPPHASHFGGIWERMIGTCRRVLDGMLLENKSITLTHEVLSTLMAEVCAIVNSRPLLPVSSDPEAPTILSPSMVLTQKQTSSSLRIPQFGTKDALRSQWKLVQHFADIFWTKWRVEYLNSLQTRAKWMSDGDHFKEGDIVLVKNVDTYRNQWPLGIINQVFLSEDSKVRKVKVSVMQGNSRISYVRPICELVKLFEMTE